MARIKKKKIRCVQSLSQESARAALDSADVRERVSGISAFADIGDLSSMSTISAVIEIDPSDYVASMSIVFLNTIHNGHINALRMLLTRDIGAVRTYGVLTALMVSRDCSSIQEVRQLLFHENWYIRLGAVRYLLRCQRDSKEFQPIIEELLMSVPEVAPSTPLTPLTFVPDMIFYSSEAALLEVKKVKRLSNRWRRTRWLI